MNKIIANKLYIFINDFRTEYPPLIYEAKKGDVVEADYCCSTYPSLGYNRFYRKKHSILMEPKEVFKYLKEYKRRK